MGGTYTIYAFFNAQQIQGVLNAVVMLVGSSGVDGDYLSMIRVAGMLGLFLAVTAAFVKARGEEAAQYLIMMAIFYSTLFVPRVSVTIQEMSGTAGAPIVVDNVPLGLAFFASTTSHIGYWLTDKSETFFSLPDNELRLSRHGLMGGARALREAQSAAMPDPVLAQDMINFMRDCINPELISGGAGTVNSLMESTNLWADFNTLGLVNPGRMVTLSGGLGAEPCSVAYTNTIGTRLNPAANSEFARIARMITPNATAAMANTMLASMLPAAEGMIMTASASTTEAIKQRMMINMLNDTSANMAQIMNDPTAAQTALGASMAASQANSSYRIMAKLASETLPLVRSAIELVILGVFPIVLILIIIAGAKGGTVLRSYVMTMLWVQMWAPIYAIVNYVGTLSHATSAKAALDGIDGVAIANAAVFANTAISSEAVVGMLTIAVPIIALAIVKGGEVAMSGVVASLTGGTDRAAQTAGGQVGVGNANMGNLSWGNVNSNNSSTNKSDESLGYNTPSKAHIGSQQGSYDILSSGQFANLQANVSNVGATAGVSSDATAKNTTGSGVEGAKVRGMETSLGTGTSGRFSESESASFDAKFGQALTKRFGGGQTFTGTTGAANATSAGSDVSMDQGVRATEGLAITSNLSAGAGVERGSTIQKGTNASTPLSPSAAPTGPAALPTTPGQMPSVPQGGIPQSGVPQGGIPQSGVPQGGAPQGSGTKIARNLLGLDSLKSGFSAKADHGLNVRTAEEMSNGGNAKQTASERQTAESRFATIRQAALEVMANTQNSGERAAGQKILGELAQATDARYQTSTRATLSDKASEENSRSDSLGVKSATNLGNEVARQALQSHGNPDNVFAAFNADPSSIARGADAVAGKSAAQTLPENGSPVTGIGGGVVSAPKSVGDVYSDGVEAVQKDKATNTNAASEAGHAAVGKAHSAQQVALAMPDQKTGQDAFTSVSGETQSGQAALVQSQRVGSGIVIASNAIFGEEAGMGRLLKSTYGGGLFNFFGLENGGQETQAQLSRLAQSDAGVRTALGNIAATGRPTEDNVKALGGALSDLKGKLSEQYKGDWQQAFQQTGIKLFGE